MSNLVYMKRFIFLSSFASFGCCFQFDLSIFFRFFVCTGTTQMQQKPNRLNPCECIGAKNLNAFAVIAASQHTQDNRISLRLRSQSAEQQKKIGQTKNQQTRRRERRMKAQPKKWNCNYLSRSELACECVYARARAIAFAISRNLLTNFCVRFATRCTVFCTVCAIEMK